MTFEETFKNWTLEQKVEWALGPNICNLSENMRSIIVDLKAENERLNGELKQTEAQDQVVINGLRNALWKARAERAEGMLRFFALALNMEQCKKWEWVECKCLAKAKEYERLNEN